MLIGKLRHRLCIQRQIQQENENKITVSSWQTIATVWGDANGLFGKEYWDAKKYGGEDTVEFVIRYSSVPDLNRSDRIVFRGRVYNIIDIDNLGFRNKTLKIKAKEIIE